MRQPSTRKVNLLFRFSQAKYNIIVNNNNNNNNTNNINNNNNNNNRLYLKRVKHLTVVLRH